MTILNACAHVGDVGGEAETKRRKKQRRRFIFCFVVVVVTASRLRLVSPCVYLGGV